MRVRKTARISSAALAAMSLLLVTGLTASAGQDGPGRQPAYVDSVAPIGDAVPTDAAITVTFTQPVSPESFAFTINPAVSGDPVWVDDYTVRLQPIGLLHGVTYELGVRGRSVDGGPLKGSTHWRFSTAAGPATTHVTGSGAISVPILMYHYVRTVNSNVDYMGYRLSVTPRDFASQMDWLAHNGYHTVTTEELMGYLSGSNGLPAKPIILTFDDGYADFYSSAIPILRSHDFTAVSYVVAGFIGRPGYMTSSQIVAAHRAGFEIGSHTVDHVNLTRQSDIGLRYQLVASKQALETILGSPVISFCYPYGKYGAREMAAAEAAGYHDATVASVASSMRTAAGRYSWSRIRVTGGASLSEFAFNLTTN